MHADEPIRRPRALFTAFATLHAIVLVLTGTWIVRATGPPPDSSVLEGLVLGAWLVVITIAATAWTCRGIVSERALSSRVIGRAALAGVVAGPTFVGGAILLLTGLHEPRAVDSIGLAFWAAWISWWAALIGVLIGVAVALVDLWAYKVGTRLRGTRG